MAHTGGKKLIIKLYLPRSGKHVPPSSEASSDHTCGQKRKKIVDSEVSAKKPRSTTETTPCYNTESSVVAKIQTLKENTRVVRKESRIMLEECGVKEGAKYSCSKMMKKVATDEVSDVKSTECPTKTFVVGKSGTPQCGVVKEKLRGGSRISRTGCEGCKLEKVEGVDVELEEKEKKRPRNMDRYKKMQCWVILKRLMTGRDSWPFKHSLFLKDLEILDKSDESMSQSQPIMGVKNNIKSELGSTETIMKPIGLEDIESKLNKWLYFEPDDFAYDMRLVFSYALLHPPRNEIHKIARRHSEDFELRWKSLKEKWAKEERKGKKICKREVYAKS